MGKAFFFISITLKLPLSFEILLFLIDIHDLQSCLFPKTFNEQEKPWYHHMLVSLLYFFYLNSFELMIS